MDLKQFEIEKEIAKSYDIEKEMLKEIDKEIKAEEEIIQDSLAIADAVIKESPVIMIGLIPALKHFFTESLTLILGGSIIPTKPANINSFSCSISSSEFAGIFLISLYAKPITLNALRANSSSFALISSINELVSFVLRPSI